VETGSECAEAVVEEPPVKAGVEEPPVKAGIEEPSVKAGIEEPPVKVAVEPAEARVEEPSVKVVVEAAVVRTAAVVKTAAVATATMVLRLARTGRHEHCRPGKEQHATVQEYFPKHGLPPLLMPGVSDYLATVIPDA
jgi:hypothetical protein